MGDTQTQGAIEEDGRRYSRVEAIIWYFDAIGWPIAVDEIWALYGENPEGLELVARKAADALGVKLYGDE